MASTTINIHINLPSESINLHELKQKVTLYAQFMANHLSGQKEAEVAQLRFSSLKGVLRTNSHLTEKQIVDEYLSKKYKL